MNGTILSIASAPRTPMCLRFAGALFALVVLSACGIVKVESAATGSPQRGDPRTRASRTTHTSSALQKHSAPQEAASKVADLNARLTAILAEPNAAVAIDELGELRLSLLQRRHAALAALSENERRQLSAQQRSRVLGADAHALLRRIHHERARLYLERDRIKEALAEVSVQGGAHRHAVLLECGNDEVVCKDVRAAVTKRFQGICASDHCTTDVDYLWNQRSPAILEVRISSVKKVASGWLVTGGEFGPDTYRRCVDSFQTDKVLGVDRQRIEIERTTWCRKFESQHRRGYRYTYLLTDLPFAPTYPGKLVILADPARFKTRAQGTTDSMHVDRPVVLELRSRKSTSNASGAEAFVDAQVFRHNQQIAPELLNSLIY